MKRRRRGRPTAEERGEIPKDVKVTVKIDAPTAKALDEEIKRRKKNDGPLELASTPSRRSQMMRTLVEEALGLRERPTRRTRYVVTVTPKGSS